MSSTFSQLSHRINLSILVFQSFNLYYSCLWITLMSTLFIWSVTPLRSQTVADTFDTAEIPTNLGSYSATCNGPLTQLSIALPSGGPWTVTGIDIAYHMTALSGGLRSHQRSYIRCQNTATSEDTIYLGSGGAGVQAYNRPGVTIANGSYSGNTLLHFEMRAWRTTIGSGCNTTYNRVDIFTWIITVHYSQIPDEGSVGIGTTTPATSAILDLTSTTQAFLPPRMTTSQRDAIAVPIPGMMIFNTTTQNLEIFTSGWGSISFSSPGVKKLMGGSANDQAYSIQQTNDGGFIAAGTSASSNTGTLTGLTNNGSYDDWILKLDNSGNIIWQKLLGGSVVDYAYSIQQTTDGGYIIAGWSNSSNTGTLLGLIGNGLEDYWILKLDSSGNIIWQKLLGGSNSDLATSVQQTTDGGYIIAGYSISSNTGTLVGLINNGSFDYWILKLDENGNIVWQKLLGGGGFDAAFSIKQTTDGGYIIAGYSSSSNTGTLTGLTTNGNDDDWILKLDSSGNIIWQKLLGGSGLDHAQSIQQTIDGGFIVAGTSVSSNTGTLTGLINNGSNDYWIFKLDDSGNIVWQKLLGGSLGDYADCIQQTSDGGFIAAGTSASSNTGTLLGLTNNGNNDYWILKLDNIGIIVWQKLLGGSLSEYDAYDSMIQQTNDGGFIIAGSSSSSNTGTLLGLTNNGGVDYWMFKLDENGNPK